MKVSKRGTKLTSWPVFAFGDFRLDVGRRLLLRSDGGPVPLTPRVFDTLRFLVEHSDTVLDKERLMEAIWPDSIVEENNLTQSISKLRQVLGEEPGAHRFIVTIPGRGYRFVAEVKTAEQAASEANPEIETKPDLSGIVPEIIPPVSQEEPAARRRHLWLFSSVAILIFLLGAAAFFEWRGRRVIPFASPVSASSVASVAPEKSIAVRPFENLSDDRQNAYFAAAVQDEILSNLAKIADLKVISRTSSNLYKTGHPRNSREIGQQLGVAYLLEGNVQRARDRVRVNAQLVDARTDTHLWAQTYDRDVADVFAIQTEIARAIAGQLRAKISPSEKAAIAQAPTSDLVANALYQQALAIEAKEFPNSQDLMEAARLLDQAIARDSQFVLAYCLLGRVHTHLFYGNFDHTPARRELAKAALKNALRLQPEPGEVHLALAYYAYYSFFDYDRARAELELARRALPNGVEVYYLAALLDRRQGRWNEAIRNAERAVELDPHNVEHVMVPAQLKKRCAAIPIAADCSNVPLPSSPATSEPASCAPTRRLRGGQIFALCGWSCLRSRRRNPGPRERSTI